MAKRGAEKEMSKDDYTSDESADVDPGVRNEALKPVEGRVIRGMPKRKGLASPSKQLASSSALAPGSSTTNFSFNPSSATPSFSFGDSSNGPASSLFSFGSSAASAVPPAVPVAATPSPFSGFSFGKKSTDPSEAPQVLNEATVASSSFGRSPVNEPAAANLITPSVVPTYTNFVFKPKPPSSNSTQSTLSSPATLSASSRPAAPTSNEPVPPPKPFAGFSFGAKPKSASATTAADTSISASIIASDDATMTPVSQPSPVPASVTPARVPSFSKAAAPALPSSGPAPSQDTPPDEGEVAYYTSLRGLNTSFLSFVSQEINANDFLDLSTVLPSVLAQYKVHQREAGHKAGWKPELRKVEGEGLANGSVPDTVPVLITTPKLPVPPSVGSFSLLKSAVPSSTPYSGGFVPDFGASKSTSSTPPAFNFTQTSIEATPLKKTSSTVNQIVAEVLTKDNQSGTTSLGSTGLSKNDSKFSFGTTDSKSESGLLFPFAPSAPLHPTTPDSKTFAPSVTSLSPAEAPAKLGRFGPGGSAPQLAFGGAKMNAPSTPSAPSASGFSFGATSPSGTSFSFGASAASSNEADNQTRLTSSFGSTTDTAKPAATPSFSFGSTSHSTKFPSVPSSAVPFSFSATPSAPSFSFSGPSSAPASGTVTPLESAATQAEETPAEPSKNLAEAMGAGEEDEETIVEQRGKLHALENGQYVVIGLGQFKLKRAKEGGRRRLLMRADGSGAVVLNMSLQASFDPTIEASSIKFLGFDLKGGMKPYLLRVKTKDMAESLVADLKREVEIIKSQ